MPQDDLLLAAQYIMERDRIWQKYFGEEEEQSYPSRIRTLMLGLFIAHVERKKPFSKTRAGRFIRAEGSSTAAKYLNALKEQGIITFMPDENDKRKIAVILTEKGLEIMRSYLSDLIHITRTTAQQFSTP